MYRTQKIFSIVILLFIGFSITGFAQEKKIRKVENSFKTHDYEKCIKLSDKYLRKYSKTSDLYFFRSLSEFQLNKTVATVKGKKKLSRSLLSDIKKAFKYKISEDQLNEYALLTDSIKQFIGNTADTLFKTNRGQSQYFYDNLARVFLDTLENYYVFHTAGKVSVAQKEEVSVIDSISGKRGEMLRVGKKLVGTKYVWAGESPKGFDCSGFTMYMYKQIGYKLPHNAQMQSKIGISVPIEEAKPGDLIFFGYFTDNSYRAVHAGIVYANNDGHLDLIHCVSRGVNIDKKGNSNNTYWLGRALFVKRIIGEESCINLTDNQ